VRNDEKLAVRSRRGSGWFAVLALAACSSRARPPERPTADVSAPAAESRPPGVIVDRPAYLPPPREIDDAEHRLITLSPSIDTRLALRVIDRFFEAVLAERRELLTELFEPTGRMWTGQRQRHVSLEAAWARRLTQLDYTALGGSVVYRERDREVYRPDEARELAEMRHLSVLPRGDEVLVRIRMSVTASGTDRLFGDEVVFLLRRVGDGYKIAQMREDFRLP
jgi:hypothetical protein